MHFCQFSPSCGDFEDGLARLLDGARAPFLGLSSTGRVLDWNRCLEGLLGYTKEEAVGSDFLETFVSGDHHPTLVDQFQKVSLGVKVDEIRVPITGRFGHRFILIMNPTLLRDSAGEAVGFWAICAVEEGPTDNFFKAAEPGRQAKDPTADYSELSSVANALIFKLNLEGHFIDWNRKATELSGFAKEEVMGRSFVDDFITNDYKDQVRAVLVQACRGNEAHAFEFPLMTKFGNRLDILLSTTTCRDANGIIMGVIGIAHDITQTQKATRPSIQQIISMNEANRIADDLTRLIDTANAPIFGIDTDGLVTEWNQKAAAISGWTKAETQGKPLVQSFISPAYREQVDTVLNKALNGDETANFEFPLFTKGNRRREILLNATTRRGTHGEIIGMIGVGQDITELRNLMAEQHRVADDLYRLIETANAPIFGVDIEGRVTEWNRKAADLTCYSKEETMGRPLVANFISEDYKSQVQVVLTKACQGIETANFEFPLFTKDGRRREILLNATTRRGADGEVSGVIGVGQDITELRGLAIEQKRVADDYSRLLETANAPIFGIDTHGCVTEWNRMASKITSFDKASVVGKPMVKNFIHVDQQQSVEEVFDKALQGEETANFEFHLYTKGERREILLNATPRRGPDGEVVGVVGVGQDITELNVQKREAERIATDMSRIIDTAHAPIFGVDMKGCVVEWNQMAAKLSGYSKAEILGKRLVQLLVAEPGQAKVAYVLLQALGGVETSDFEFPLVTKSGERRLLLMNATALRGKGDEITGVIGVGHDTTEIQNTAEELKRLVRNANAPIFGVNCRGEVNEWNDKAAQMSGYSRDDAIGKPLVETFIKEDYRKSVGQTLEDALTGVETSNFEFPLIHRNGSEVLVLLNAAPRRDGSNNIIGMVGVGQEITSLRQAMNEVTRVADDLGRIIEDANAPILGIDTCGNVTEWNRKAASISQYSKEEILGKSLTQTIIPLKYRDEVWRVLERALEGVEESNYEFPLLTKGGGEHEILFNATTRRGADGKITGVIGVGQDITRLRAITKEHERIADDLSRLIETANAPIFGVDTHGCITEWNRKAVEISGFTKQDTRNKSLVKHFIHKVHRSSVQEVLDKALDSHEVANFELTLYTKQGEQRDVLLNATPRLGPTNEVIGVVCVGQDITELKQQREEVERVAEDLARIIDTANAPIFGVDKEMCINEWNGWVASKSGYQKSEVRGQKLTNFLDESCHDVVTTKIQKACNGQPSVHFEVALKGKTHFKRAPCILLNATPRVSPQHGDIVGVICIGQDITDMKEVEDRKSSFLAMVSHELKSPLHGIIGLSTSLASGEPKKSQLHKRLLLIQNCATRLLDMVSNIMDASVLVQEKKMKFSKDSVQISKIVEEVVDLCEHSLDKQGKKMVRERVQLINCLREVPDLPQIEADSHRCTQLVWNLVTNALKFTHEGYVKVLGKIDEGGKSLTITVEDTGIGIAPENLERIFKPFDQEDQSEKRRYDGLGLGLAICKEVAVRHGGTLSVESERGKGSSFHATLPIKPPKPGPNDPSPGGDGHVTSKTIHSVSALRAETTGGEVAQDADIQIPGQKSQHLRSTTDPCAAYPRERTFGCREATAMPPMPSAPVTPAGIWENFCHNMVSHDRRKFSSTPADASRGLHLGRPLLQSQKQSAEAKLQRQVHIGESECSNALSQLQLERLELHRQIAHLTLDLQQKERRLAEAEGRALEHRYVVQLAENRCLQLQKNLRHLQADTQPLSQDKVGEWLSDPSIDICWRAA